MWKRTCDELLSSNSKVDRDAANLRQDLRLQHACGSLCASILVQVFEFDIQVHTIYIYISTYMSVYI